MPVLLPVTATVVSNVTLSGSAAIASSAFRLPEWPSLMPGRRRAGGGLIGDPEAGSHLGGEACSVGIEPATGDALFHQHEVPAKRKGGKPAANSLICRVSYIRLRPDAAAGRSCTA
jgi:hypothetical protein